VATVVPATTSGQGRLLTFQVTGATSGLTGQVMVQLPESYSASGSTTRSYPVLESFPTYPGTPLSLFKNFDLTTGFTSAIGNGKVGDFLLVVPQTWFPGRADTECINGPSGTPQVEDWIAKDVPAWLAQHFRVKQDRNSWATIGVSAGAWCASMAAYLHPNLYSAAISMGGYFTPTFEGPPPFPPGSPRLARYDLTRRVAVNPPPIAMLVTTSKQDQVSYPTTSRFVAAARAPLAIDSRIFASGGHRWSQWAPLLGPALAWLGKTAPGFKP
jgi:pimeloyl-ACP methyl ester carboxylesterase